MHILMGRERERSCNVLEQKLQYLLFELVVCLYSNMAEVVAIR